MNNKPALSARWSHPEGENLPTGRVAYEGKRVAHGDISSWSRGTTKAIRPEVGRIRTHFQPIRSLKSCAVLDKVRSALSNRNLHDPSSVVVLRKEGRGEIEKALKECDKIITIAEKRFSSTDYINNILHGLATKGGTVKEYK